MNSPKLSDTYHVISFWSDQSSKNYSAPKVRRDFLKVARQLGVHIINIDKDSLNTLESRLKDEKVHAERMNKKLATLVQYPLKPLLNVSSPVYTDAVRFISLVNAASDKRVVLAHDIKSVQGGIFEKAVDPSQLDAVTAFEDFLFTGADSLITHSQPMADYLISHFKLRNKQMIPLEMFDYLGAPVPNDTSRTNPASIAFAGYLGAAKNSLIKRLFQELPTIPDGTFNLYGPDFQNEEFSRRDIVYRGSIDSDELPLVLNRENSAGLLWDNLDEKQRFYYKMISPHKCSLYVRSFLPLIVPSGTYMEDVVKKLNIGIVIDRLSDLRDVDKTMLNINFDNLRILKEKVETGHFTATALRKALE